MNTNVATADDQMAKIRAISEATGVATDELVREAIDRLIAEKVPKTGDWREATRAVFGIWKDRDDLEETFRSFRDGFDNRYKKLFPEA